jgi:nicotinamide phosphoribosyltransferase
MNNIILKTDSYKASHQKQYPVGTNKVFSYIESRGGVFAETLFFGLQMFLMDYLSRLITKKDISEAESFFVSHGLPFNTEGWNHIVNDHYGVLPLKIRAVPEGSIVPTNNVLVTVENTCGKCFWVPSYIETALLRGVWYPTTVATISYHARRIIIEYLRRTSDKDPVAESLFKLHDFGARGVSSGESAKIGGAAHLVNFMGSDTVEGVLAANHYYKEKMSGFSIPASEHSTMTSWGKDGELEAFRNMLYQFGGSGKMLAVVSDSYDIYNAVKSHWGETLKQDAIDSGSVVVIRPDSGHPPKIVNDILGILYDSFGGTTNSKGCKILHPSVRVIQGDGCDLDMIETILKTMQANQWSAENITFGMGGGLLQHCNRDTLQFAMKTSYVEVNGIGMNVFKAPVTDPGKKSKTGLLTLIKDNLGYQTKDPSMGINSDLDVMEDVYCHGSMYERSTLEDIRKRVNNNKW